jgi:1,4-alpha-glucan branching enzyme
LNRVYRQEPALHVLDSSGTGFEWVDCNDYEASVLSFIRKTAEGDPVLIVANFTPVPRYPYQVGVPRGGYWKELLNSDAHDYGGSGQGNQGGCEARPERMHGRDFMLELTVPPLGAVFLKPV